MTPDPGTIVTIAGLAVAGVIWLVRLEGRVNGHDIEHKTTREDIRYIRDRIDRALNGHGE
jgi:hypothetical protein